MNRLPQEIQNIIMMFCAKPQDAILLEDIKSFVNDLQKLKVIYRRWFFFNPPRQVSYCMRHHLCLYCNDFQRVTSNSALTQKFQAILGRRGRRLDAIYFKEHDEVLIGYQIRMLFALLTHTERREFHDYLFSYFLRIPN